MNVDEWMIGDASAVNLSKVFLCWFSGSLVSTLQTGSAQSSKHLIPTVPKDFKWLVNQADSWQE